MKQLTIFLTALLAVFTMQAQDITLSFENPEITNDGMDSFYEIDVMISSDVDLSMGSGQFFLDYNSDAFGIQVDNNGAIEYERPENTLLGGAVIVDVGGTPVPLGDHYSSFISNDTTDDKVSFIWQQNASGGMYGDNVPAGTPLALVHVKFKFLGGAEGEDPAVCFDANNPFDDQFFTACGPFEPLIGFNFEGADCQGQPGSQILDYTPDCSLPTASVCDGLMVTTFGVGGWDNGDPDLTKNAVIDANFSTAFEGTSIEACSCTVNAELSIDAGDHLSTTENITVNGTMIVAQEGSVVQTSETALTINNGSIEVRKTTPSLNPRDFILLSSPMDGESPTGVYATADRVFEIIPEEFTPNNDPAIVGLNFLDDDGSYTMPASNLQLGQGYLVFPQNSTDTDPIEYSHTHTLGTLNSGPITAPLTYNGPATENNFQVLGNPYASAIDTDVLIQNNASINEVFYWEHITAPNETLPGFNNENYSMDDVSIRNLTGGVASNNGGTAPGQFMASGQGFGILALQSASGTDLTFTNSLRVAGNNDDLRNAQSDNRLWLQMDSDTYTSSSTILIGFLETATDGFDAGYDTQRMDASFSLYSTLDSEEQLAIQARETFDTEMEISLGIESKLEHAETFTISIAQLEGIELENNTIFLVDHLTGVTINLKNEDYSFTATNGLLSDRFSLIFEAPLLNTEEIETGIQMSMFPNPIDEGNLTVVSTQLENQKVTVTLTSLIGQQLYNEQQQFTGNTLTVTALQQVPAGMYFVTIASETQQVTQRLIKE